MLRLTISRFIASGCYSGYTPLSPGTAGSALCLLFWYLCRSAGLFESYPSQIIVVLFCCLLGLSSTRICLDTIDSAKAVAEHGKLDPQFIVIDEWAGLLIALLGVNIQLIPLLSAFALFRVFDILKPGPVRWAERLPGAWGIMADDLVAGLFATAIMHAVMLNIA